jgi:uncharacterized protein (TIGR02996 family)
MSDEQRDHLAYIIAHPDDDAPRLVYADWLQEHANHKECLECKGTGIYVIPAVIDMDSDAELRHGPCNGTGRISNGFAERAEFIRVQCELARLDPYHRSCTGDKCGAKKCNDLRKRERELLWRTDMPAGIAPVIPNGYAHMIRWSFSRGFIDSITTNWATCRDHLDAILAEHPVRLVRLTSMPSHALGDYFSQRQHMLILHARWPSVGFELPKIQESEPSYSESDVVFWNTPER